MIQDARAWPQIWSRGAGKIDAVTRDLRARGALVCVTFNLVALINDPIARRSTATFYPIFSLCILGFAVTLDKLR